MCTISVSCPLCSHTSFPSVASLRISLIKAINSPLTCPICQEIVMGLDKLTLHLITHNNTGINNENAENDLLINTREINSFCNEINSNGVTLNNLPSLQIKQQQQHQLHNKQQSETNPSNITNTPQEQQLDEPRCDICGLTFRNFDILQKHTKVMHSYKCNDDNFLVKFKKQTQDSDNNSAPIQFYPCHLCSKSYKMKARLRLHLKVKHFIGLPSGIDKNKLNICEKIRMIKQQNSQTNEWTKPLTTTTSPTNQSMALKSPSKVSTDNSLLEINTPIGTESVSEPKLLNDYISTSPRNETVKTWKCDICSKFYTTKYFLKKHKRIHTGETPYTCEICNKSFTFQQSYHKHLLYHSDEKPHICKICGRAFKELSTLHNHERIHSGEKPFECETCGKRFRQRVSNYVHQRTHTGVKPYNCDLCNKKFRYKVTLRTHKCTGALNSSPLQEINSATVNDQHLKLFSTPNDFHDNEKILNEKSKHIGIETGTEFNNAVKETTTTTSSMTDEMLLKSIDDIVAESCRHLFIDNSDINCISTNNYKSNNDGLDVSLLSPTTQLQNLCLYSPVPMENLDNISADETLKQLIFELETKKNV